MDTYVSANKASGIFMTLFNFNIIIFAMKLLEISAYGMYNILLAKIRTSFISFWVYSSSKQLKYLHKNLTMDDRFHSETFLITNSLSKKTTYNKLTF